MTEAMGERDRLAEAVEAQRQQYRKLDLRTSRAREVYGQLLDDGDPLAARALVEADRIERDRDDLAADIRAMEERLGGWTEPEVDQLLDFYTELQKAVNGRLKDAEGVEDVNRELRAVLASAMVWIDPDGSAAAVFAVNEEMAGRLPYHDLEVVDGRLVLACDWPAAVPGDEPDDAANFRPRRWLAEPDARPRSTAA